MPYLVMTSPAGRPSAFLDALVLDLEEGHGWRAALKAFGLAVMVKGARPPDVNALKDGLKAEGVLIGRVFDRQPDAAGRARRADLSGLTGPEPIEACRVLCDNAFGSYVVVLAQDRSAPAILRSPDGMIDAFTWRREDITLVGDDVPEGLAAPWGLAIDWEGLGQILAHSVRAVAGPPLRGIKALDPGVCRHGQGLGQDTRVWSPADVVRRGPLRTTPAVLRAAVDLAISADLDGAVRVLCEISGGLDSAIVAASLAAAGRPADLAVNFWRDQPESDERVYAQAAADLARAPLRAIHRDLLRLDAHALNLSARSVRPNLAAVDPDYDRLLVETISAIQADVMMTGNGGDVVFYQVGAAEIVADLLAGAACEGARLQRIADIARRTRRSVWSLVWEALTGRPGANAPQRDANESDFIRTRPSLHLHPWTRDVRGVSRAKRVQIEGLVNSLGLTAHTARGDATRLAHPLLAQPVVELCLRTPIPLLSSGEGERTFARRAFADRLPDSISNRRSKGDVTTYFGRSMAASAPFLRGYLLDGRLVAEGLLDPDRLEVALTPESLIWRNTYGNILLAAGLEAWVRHWEGRTSVGAAGAPRASARKAKARA